jgi:hypothetical protein
MTSGIKSAKLKLGRAAKHLRAIKQSIAIYSARRPHKFTKAAKGTKRLNILKPPPHEISILAGEMVYQMRSALDHLAFDIVKLNTTAASSADRNWQEHCQFPLKTRVPGGTLPAAKNKFAKDLPGISDRAFAVIEGMQPYYGKGELNNALGFLAYLSNIDKHRHLNLIRTRVRRKETVKYRSGLNSKSSQALDRGAIIFEPRGWDESDRPLQVNRSYRAFVAFKKGGYLGEAALLSVDHLLSLILDNINTAAVPALRELLKSPAK